MKIETLQTLITIIVFYLLIHWMYMIRKRIPSKTIEGKVINKRIEEFKMRNGKYRSLFLVFLTSDGDIVELQIMSKTRYGNINVGDVGEIIYKGTFLKTFKSSSNNT